MVRMIGGGRVEILDFGFWIFDFRLRAAARSGEWSGGFQSKIEFRAKREA